MTTDTTFSDSDLFGGTVDLPVYKSVQMQVAVFFGGPLAATYMMAKNFKQLGMTDMVRKTWLYGIGATIGYLLITLSIPTHLRFINYGITISLIYAVRSLVARWQGPQLDEHVAQGGKVISNWNVVGVVLIVLLVMIAIIVPYYIYVAYDQLQRNGGYGVQ